MSPSRKWWQGDVPVLFDIWDECSQCVNSEESWLPAHFRFLTQNSFKFSSTVMSDTGQTEAG